MTENTGASGKPRRKIQLILPFIGVLVLLLLIAAAVLHFYVPDRTFSAEEKRVLQEAPRLSADTLLRGAYTGQLETYLADQFPERGLLMRFRMSLSWLLGQRESHGVWYAAGDYLVDRFDEPDPDLTSRNREAVRDFLARHPEQDAYFMIVPTKASMLRDQLPVYAEPGDQDAFTDGWYAALDGLAVPLDVRPALTKALREGTQAYYRSDHHWTADGAYAAWLAVSGTMGLPQAHFSRAVVYNRFSGSLSAKSGWQLPYYDHIVLYTPDDASFRCFVREEASGETTLSCFHPEALDGADPYEFYFGGNAPMLTVETSADTDRTLLVFKDSYANTFLPFLLPAYRKIVIIDPRYYTFGADTLFWSEDFDDVLFLYSAGTLAEDISLKKVLEE